MEKIKTNKKARTPRLEMDYPKALLQIWRFADQDSSRYALGFIRVDFKNAIVESTDGRIAVRQRVAFDDSFAALEPVLLYSGDLKRVAKFFAQKIERPAAIKLVMEKGKWYAEDTVTRFHLQTDDGRWPNTEQIFDPQPTRVAKFTINARLLRKMCDAYADLSDEPAFEFSVPLDSSIVVSLKCGNAIDSRVSLMSNGSDKQSITVEPPIDVVTEEE